MTNNGPPVMLNHMPIPYAKIKGEKYNWENSSVSYTIWYLFFSEILLKAKWDIRIISCKQQDMIHLDGVIMRRRYISTWGWTLFFKLLWVRGLFVSECSISVIKKKVIAPMKGLMQKDSGKQHRVEYVFRSYKIRATIFGSLTEAKSKNNHIP